MYTRGQLYTHVHMYTHIHFSACVCLKVWVATGRISKNDWVEWLCQLGVELLKESPSPTLHSCWALVQVYNPLPQQVECVSVHGCESDW